MEATTKTTTQDGVKDQAQSNPQKPEAKVEPADSLDKILERARQGDRTVIPQLSKLLKANPSIWQDSCQLVAATERAWVSKIAETNLLFSQSIPLYIAKMKRDLLGPSSSPLEKLMVERIVIAWLGVQHAELMEATGEVSGGKLAQARLRQLESASKRFLAATKILAVIRRLTHGLKIEINHTHHQPVANNGSGTNAPSDLGEPANAAAVHDRLKNFFEAGAETVESAAVGVAV